jgi:hypothetical protein
VLRDFRQVQAVDHAWANKEPPARHGLSSLPLV